MNQKGTILGYGIILGMLIAIGLFFSLGFDASSVNELEGEWSLNFINENYLKAENELLILDQSAKKIGDRVLTEMALNGGFKDNSICGKLKGFNEWNDNDQACFPEINLISQDLVKNKLEEKFPTKSFSKLEFNQNRLIGIGNLAQTTSEIGTYTYQNNFNVKLTHSISEYTYLFQLSLDLIEKCQNNESLYECLNSNKPVAWFYQSCQDEEFYQESSKVLFCVLGKTQLEYHFALDFNITNFNKLQHLQN